MRTVDVVTESKLLHGFDLFILFIQAGASDALLEEANECVLIRVEKQLIYLGPVHCETFFDFE